MSFNHNDGSIYYIDILITHNNATDIDPYGNAAQLNAVGQLMRLMNNYTR